MELGQARKRFFDRARVRLGNAADAQVDHVERIYPEVSEIVVDGATGFICSTLTEMVAALPRVRELDRRACRVHVEQRFSGAAMVDGYERAYTHLLDDVRSSAPSRDGQDGIGPDLIRLARS